MDRPVYIIRDSRGCRIAEVHDIRTAIAAVSAAREIIDGGCYFTEGEEE